MKKSRCSRRIQRAFLEEIHSVRINRTEEVSRNSPFALQATIRTDRRGTVVRG